MNLPNKITLLRIALIPVFMIFAFPYPEFMQSISFPGLSFLVKYSDLIALILFVVAASTDAVDGHIARKYNLVTDFGKFLDPIADKLLVTAALLALMCVDKVYAWATMIILIREFIVTGLRLVAGTKGIVIAAGQLGKLKTVFQTAALSVLLAAPVFPAGGEKIVYIIGDILMGIAVLLTIVSGVEYIYKNRKVILESK
ncbi:MAG: CDP-diacylglycerol--glycerol-3-phosphate 3-phosphatidyltransferase [Clostridia bacterium]|nr:CDP-diacylglycerol--glycerol-3-phosphate 3-phosphatidyltransferase [Clostridia bacterium]